MVRKFSGSLAFLNAKWLPSALSLGAGVGAAVIFAVVLNRGYPLETWLAWDFARIWIWQALFCAACLSFGHLLLVRVLRLSFPPLERAVMSMALGVIAFAFGMYLGGALRLYGPVFAVVLPTMMVVAGLPTAAPALREALAQLREQRPPAAPLGRFISGFGLLAVAFVYLQSATPDSISYDASWSHLVVAEDYARAGRIVPFIAETPKNLPHLSSILYTWGFLVPGLSHPAQRWMMAQHTEFLLFLWTLIAVTAAVRWVLETERVRGAWAAYFLFPGYFVYDANLGGGSDHVAAFFALPFLLASVRAAVTFSSPLCALAGLMAGAALHTKYQCIYLLGPMIAWLAARWVIEIVRSFRSTGAPPASGPLRRDLWRAALLFAAGILVGFGPHLVKNWLFYRNPAYPLMLHIFRGSVPSFPDLPYSAIEGSAPSGDQSRFGEVLRLMFTFSFDPQYSFVGKLPHFGSLFTLLIPIAVIHGRRRRLLLALFLAQGAIFMWALIYPVDRNLQLLLPWLVTVTAAAIAAAWQSGWLARAGLVPILVLQLAWGAKFIIAGGADRLHGFIELVRGDLNQTTADARYANYRRFYRELGEALPQNAVLLLHTAHIQLGINRRTLSDWAGWQYAIDYRTMRTPRDVYLRFHALGITHMVWNNYDFPSLKQEDVLFFAFTRRYAVPRPAPGGFLLWEMPAEPPPVEAPLQVLTLGLNGYSDGLYTIDKLGVFEDLPPARKRFPAPDAAASDPPSIAAALRRADALLVVRNQTFDAPSSEELLRCFTREHEYYAGYGIAGYAVHLRKRGAAGCEPSAP